MNYRESGVDIAEGDAWIETIKSLAAEREHLPKAGIGGFSGIISIGGGRSIVACCDGVGTKVELARKTGLYRGLGQDLVAMSVNDLVTCGAIPLFFLDYIACGTLDEPKLANVMKGILDGCEQSGCALLGGETAEMPGVYAPDGFDLAGFAVGLIDDCSIIDGSQVKYEDMIIALPSSGVHSNGFSLIRKILSDMPENTLSKFGDDGTSLGEILMRPTKIYVRAALEAARGGFVKGMAHITGGGLEANANRVVPDGLRCEIDYGAWRRPRVFGFISGAGVDEAEMRRVFNLGVGYVFIASQKDGDCVMKTLSNAGESPFVIGRIVRE